MSGVLDPLVRQRLRRLVAELVGGGHERRHRPGISRPEHQTPARLDSLRYHLSILACALRMRLMG